MLQLLKEIAMLIITLLEVAFIGVTILPQTMFGTELFDLPYLVVIIVIASLAVLTMVLWFWVVGWERITKGG